MNDTFAKDELLKGLDRDHQPWALFKNYQCLETFETIWIFIQMTVMPNRLIKERWLMVEILAKILIRGLFTPVLSSLYTALPPLSKEQWLCGYKALIVWILKVENWFVNLETYHLEMWKACAIVNFKNSFPNCKILTTMAPPQTFVTYSWKHNDQ